MAADRIIITIPETSGINVPVFIDALKKFMCDWKEFMCDWDVADEEGEYELEVGKVFYGEAVEEE